MRVAPRIVLNDPHLPRPPPWLSRHFLFWPAYWTIATAGIDKNLAKRGQRPLPREFGGIEFNGRICYRAQRGYGGFVRGACYLLARGLLRFAETENSRYATVA
jgi:hypothetical protein